MGRRMKVTTLQDHAESMARVVPKQHAATKARLAAIKKVAASFSSLQPASKTLTYVQAVPTCFIQLDHAVRVGGLPVERFSVVHGPSNHGKTVFILGLLKSFIALDHFALFIDAERTTPRDWVETMLGPDAIDHPGFLYKRPETYEKTVADVREFCLGIANAKEEKKLPEDMSGIIVVDSIRKLVPASIMKQIEEENDKGQDANPSRRAAQIKAAMNANWLDELVPILERARVGMVVIAREMEDPDASVFSKKFGTNYKVQGGGALIYDASLRMRVERASWVTKEAAKEGAAPTVYGERHRVTIAKTKVGGKDDKASRCYFHTSNGVWLPEGFDMARDVLELGLRFGIVAKSGAHYSYGNEKLGQGEHNAVKRLAHDIHGDGMIHDIARLCREKFASFKPLEEDVDGVAS